MKIALTFVLLLSISVGAYGQTPTIDKIEIIETGIYQAKISSERFDPNSPSGKILSATSMQLIKSTTTIPAQLGIRFGFRYRVVGQVAGARVALKIVSHFPAPGLRNNKTNQQQLSYELMTTKTIGDVTYFDWLLDDPSDLRALGNWMIGIWDGNQKMVAQQFILIKP